MTSLGEKLTEEELSEMMKEADLNGNGFIEFEGTLSIKSQSALVEYPLEFLVRMYNRFFPFQWKVGGFFLPALFYTSRCLLD